MSIWHALLSIRWTVAVLATAIFLIGPAQAQQRVALVIGNGVYRSVPTLPNPTNDASDIAEALSRLGFSVKKIENADFNSMRVALLDFGRRARGAEMAVVFFAGHGIEIGGENWLIPVDAELKSDIDTESEAIGLRSATIAVSGATKLGLVILDACRNNPFAMKMERTNRRRAVDRGLARVEPTGNVLVAYAAKDGTTADDGASRNSPFTAALLKNLETPGLEVTFLFRNVRDDVMEATKDSQQPFIYGSLSKEAIYFKAALTKPEPRLDPLAVARAKWAGWRLTPQVGHALPVISIAMSHDGRRLASGGLDMSIKIWQAETGRLLRTIVGHRAPVTSIAFSPDGRRVASGSLDTTIKIWDVDTGAVLETLEGAKVPVTSIAFSLDGRFVVSGSADSKIELWEIGAGRAVQTLEGHSRPVFSVTFSRDRRQIVSGSFDNTIKIWDASTFKLVRTLQGHSAPVLSVALSPDGRTLISGSLDKTVRMWDTESGKLLRTLGFHSASVLSVAFSRDGRRIASGSLDGVVKLWDASTSQIVQTFKAHGGQPIAVAGMLSGWILGAISGDFSGLATDILSWAVSGGVPGTYSLAFSFDSRQVFSAGGDGNIKVWDVATGQPLRTLEGHSDSVIAVAFSPDGRRIASGGFERSVKLWDAATLQHVRTLEGHLGIVTSIAVSLDGRQIASGSFDSSIRLWSAETGKLDGALEGHLDAVTSVAFSFDGRWIVSGSADKTVRIWNADTLQLTRTLEGHSEAVTSVAFSPDGRRIVSASFDHTVKVWDTRTGQILSSFDSKAGGVLAIAISADGRRIASTALDSIKVWDADTGEQLSTLEVDKRGSPGNVPDFFASVAFSPDGRRIAAGSFSQIIQVWDTGTWQPIRSLEGHLSLVSAISFSPDGRRIVSAGFFDKTVRLWDLESGRLLTTMLSLGAGDYVAIGADGFFSASPGAFEHLRLVRGSEAIQVPDDYKAAFIRERTLEEIAAALR